MKKLLTSATALLCLTTGAVAGDLPSRLAPGPVAAAPIFSWTGFYVGVQAGYAWGDDETRLFSYGIDVTPLLVGDTNFDMNGFLGGVNAGFNYQIGTVLLGVEGDVEAASAQGRWIATTLGGLAVAKTEINVQGSVRGRIGLGFDRTFVYGTAGLAFANVENTFGTMDGRGTIVTEGFEETQWGWTVGTGIDYAITNNVIGRAEYRYTRFDSYRNNSTVILLRGAFEQEPDFHTLRVGVGYKFGTY